MKIICVLDLDETLGYYDNNKFNVRPHAHLLLDFLVVMDIDIILWSYGTDSYVEHVINNHFNIFRLTNIKTYVFGRTVCDISKHRHGYSKCSEIIRQKYEYNNVVIIAIDDRVNKNMDDGYNLRIHVEPYKKVANNDDELFRIMIKIIEFCKNLKAC